MKEESSIYLQFVRCTKTATAKTKVKANNEKLISTLNLICQVFDANDASHNENEGGKHLRAKVNEDKSFFCVSVCCFPCTRHTFSNDGSKKREEERGGGKRTHTHTLTNSMVIYLLEWSSHPNPQISRQHQPNNWTQCFIYTQTPHSMFRTLI